MGRFPFLHHLENRLRCQDHPCPTAKGGVIDTSTLVTRTISDIDRRNFGLRIALCPPQYGLTRVVVNDFREQRVDVDSHFAKSKRPSGGSMIILTLAS